MIVDDILSILELNENLAVFALGGTGNVSSFESCCTQAQAGAQEQGSQDEQRALPHVELRTIKALKSVINPTGVMQF